MENSKAYLYLIEQLDVNLKNGDDEIDIRAFEDLLPNEVGYIESRIVNSFKGKNGNYKWAKFMPLLHSYNGVDILKETLQVKPIPSEDSLYIAIVLLKVTGDVSYLKIIEDNIYKANQEKEDYIYIIAHNKNDSLLHILEKVYINDEDEKLRSIAIEGILYNVGQINDIDDLAEFIEKRDYINSFILNDASAREKCINELKLNMQK